MTILERLTEPKLSFTKMEMFQHEIIKRKPIFIIYIEIEIRYKVVGKNIFSPLFVLYALKDRKIKLSLRIL